MNTEFLFRSRYNLYSILSLFIRGYKKALSRVWDSALIVVYPECTPCARLQRCLCACPFGTSCIYTHLLRVINCARIGSCDRLGTRIIAACIYLFLSHSSPPLSFCIEVTPSVRIAKRRHCAVAVGLYYCR